VSAPSVEVGAKAASISDADLLARFQNAQRMPAASRLLSFRLVRVDQAAMEVEAGFTAAPEFCNPTGAIQGGFLTAMLDDVMSVAGLVASGMTHVMPTLEMKTSFLRPAFPGPLIGVGRVVKWGKTIAFTEGELLDAERRVLARASATALPTLFKPPKG
jgi:uncharacterized protein (TIGR00369 family)